MVLLESGGGGLLHSFKRKSLLFAGYGQLAKGFGWATLVVGNIGWALLGKNI